MLYYISFRIAVGSYAYKKGAGLSMSRSIRQVQCSGPILYAEHKVMKTISKPS